MASKKLVMFKTPKKTTKTPLRIARKRVAERDGDSADLHDYCDDANSTGGSSDVEAGDEPKSKSRRGSRGSTADMLEELKSLESSLVIQLQKENAYLRNLKSDVILYQKLLGITIEVSSLGSDATPGDTDYFDGEATFRLHRLSSTGPRHIVFSLSEVGDSFHFRLGSVESCSIPEYFYDEIEFKKDAFPQFFYKMMQSLYETRSN